MINDDNLPGSCLPGAVNTMSLRMEPASFDRQLYHPRSSVLGKKKSADPERMFHARIRNNEDEHERRRFESDDLRGGG